MPHISTQIECANAHKVDIQLDISETNSTKFAVLLPGKAYRIADPIFYFIYELLDQYNFNIIKVDYGYDRNQAFEDASLDDKFEILKSDAQTIGTTLKELISDGEPLLIGKSLATIIMAELLHDPAFQPSKLAWLTPTIGLESVDRGILEARENAFMCIGTKDPSYDAARIKAYAQNGVTNCIIDDVAHVLEAEGDVAKGVLAHHRLITDLHAWLKKINFT
jgi:hypothetical protein